MMFSVLVYIFDMTLLILDKEVYTPLNIFFASIVRRNLLQKDADIFDKIVKNYKQHAKMNEIKNKAKEEGDVIKFN